MHEDLLFPGGLTGLIFFILRPGLPLHGSDYTRRKVRLLSLTVHH